METTKVISARHQRRLAAKARAMTETPAVGKIDSDVSQHFPSVQCPAGPVLCDYNGELGFTFPQVMDYVNRLSQAGATVAEICVVLGLPLHPTASGLLEEDGSVPTFIEPSGSKLA